MHFDAWDTPFLIDFIVNHHHQYVRNTIPMIQALLEKVCNAHGSDSPHVLSIRQEFDLLAAELLNHLPKEEQVLFPAIRRIADENSPASMFSPLAANVQAPLMVMEHEHDSAGRIIRSIRVLTQNYKPPVYACPTFQLTYKMLHEFDNDLMQHIHLENNILFARFKAQA